MLSNILSSHSWAMLFGLLAAIGTILAGVAAFAANVFKSLESISKISRKHDKPPPVESSLPLGAKPRIELSQVGIAPPFKVSMGHMALAGAAAGVSAKALEELLQHHHLHEAAQHLGDVTQGADHAADHLGHYADGHQTLFDHAGDVLDNLH